MERKIREKIVGHEVVDGAGVRLVRVLGYNTARELNPVLMLDAFDCRNYDDYKAGFPMHPHRGIETVSYVKKGRMLHRDSLGFEDEVSDGGVQWMCSGSGILHEEKLPFSERLLGVQLWLNLPKEDKLVKPEYYCIKGKDIEEIELGGALLRLLAGEYKEHKGFLGKHQKLNYYDIELEAGKSIKIDTKREDVVILFTLLSDVSVAGERIPEKTALYMGNGDYIKLKALSEPASILLISSERLNEDIAWAGPIVMNTKEEINQAFSELDNGSFIK